MGGGDVEEGQLVGALGVVEPGELDGVAGVAELLEVHALDDAAAVDVEARDDPDREAHSFAPCAASATSTMSARGWPSSSASGTHAAWSVEPPTSVVPSSPPVIVASKTNRCDRNQPSKRRPRA